MPSYLKLSAGAWRRLRRAWNLPADFSLLAQAKFHGPMRSALGAAQTVLAGRRRAAAPTGGAIVILGFWRSGTTLLHELLCADDRFGYPTTYACLNPHHFILTERRFLARNARQVRRPQDKMVISFRAPQEDEFALLCLGARSPYEGLIAPGNFAQALRLADPDDLSPQDARRWRETFGQFYRGVSLINGGKPLVLKSPTHSYRLPTLQALLPDARFILIVRNPYEVFESMVRAYKSLAGTFGIGPALDDAQIREVVLGERLRFEDKLQRGLDKIGRGRLATVRFEDITANPAGVLQRLYAELDLPDFARARPKLDAAIAGRSGYAPDATLPDEFWTHRIALSWREIFKRYGYAPESAMPAAEDGLLSNSSR